MNKSVTKKENNGLPFYAASAFEALGFVRHGFSTREGGVSRGVFASLNMGRAVEGEIGNIIRNRKRFCEAVGANAEEVRFARQDHSDRLFVVTSPGDRPADGEGYDGFITALPGVPLMVFTADCLPLLMVDTRKRVIAAVHCGWRGIAQDIAGKAVRLMNERFGSCPEHILAVMGPSILPCHFLTDDDVYDAMRARYGEEVMSFMPQKGEKRAVDLPGITAFSLMREGVPESGIIAAGLCTACHPDEFFTHRLMGFSRGVCAGIIALT